MSSLTERRGSQTTAKSRVHGRVHEACAKRVCHKTLRAARDRKSGRVGTSKWMIEPQEKNGAIEVRPYPGARAWQRNRSGVLLDQSCPAKKSK